MHASIARLRKNLSMHPCASFSADVVPGAVVPFHKPWSSPGKAADSPGGPPIASLYASHPPSAFEGRKSSFPGRQRPSQKRNRNPTTFNLMVRPASLFIVSLLSSRALCLLLCFLPFRVFCYTLAAKSRAAHAIVRHMQ